MNKRQVRRTQFGIAFLLLALLFSIQSIALAQDPYPSDDDVNKIAKKLYCPVCENTPLDVCPTEACRQWREQIREMLIEGKTEKEIIDYFAVTYGERAAGDPRNKLEAYLVPSVAILLGLVFLIGGFRMWRKPLETAPAYPKSETKPVPQDEYIARIEEELKKRK